MDGEFSLMRIFELFDFLVFFLFKEEIVLMQGADLIEKFRDL